jgi:enamine deaminase RidA (YjgF/YER057c/UK114 family)
LFHGFAPLLAFVAAIAKRNSVPLKMLLLSSYAQLVICATLGFLHKESAVPKTFNPPGMAPPASRYSHGAEVGAGARWLYISGQVGTAPDGSIRQGFKAQMEQVLANIATVLQTAGMNKNHLVKLTVFVTQAGPETVALYRTLRDEWLEGHAPTATYLVVAGLAHPDFLVEIEAIAASEDH